MKRFKQFILSLAVAYVPPALAVDYPHQIGDEWGRKSVLSKKKINQSGIYENQSRAVAEIALAAGVLIGFIDQDLLLLTNEHMMNAFGSRKQKGHLPIQDITFDYQVVSRYPKLDLAVLRGKLRDPADYEKIKDDAATLASDVPHQLELVAFGYGNESGGKLSWIADEDCRIFAKDGRWVRTTTGFIRHTLHGCDSSVGDSGGPIFSRTNGKLVGIQSTVGTQTPLWRYDSKEIQSRYEADPDSFPQTSVLNTMISIPVALRSITQDTEIPAEIKAVILERAHWR